jgi:hypothetical protein
MIITNKYDWHMEMAKMHSHKVEQVLCNKS